MQRDHIRHELASFWGPLSMIPAHTGFFGEFVWRFGKCLCTVLVKELERVAHEVMDHKNLLRGLVLGRASDGDLCRAASFIAIAHRFHCSSEGLSRSRLPDWALWVSFNHVATTCSFLCKCNFKAKSDSQLVIHRRNVHVDHLRLSRSKMAPHNVDLLLRQSAHVKWRTCPKPLIRARGGEP